MQIVDFPKNEQTGVTLRGWVSNKRSSKGLIFLVLRDGSGFTQCVVDEGIVPAPVFESAKSLTQESSVEMTGVVVKDEKQIGGYELQITGLRIIHISEEYPITNKPHGVDFLMDHRHLWLRSKRQWSAMRIRNRIIYSIHNFFQEEGFVQMDAPILTANACEGTSTLFSCEFYEDKAYLTQSGQLYGEAMAMAMGKIYTFGPTFRAEKSKTRRHLSEFWMIEPEMAFYDNDMNMDLIEAFLKRIIRDVMEHCKVELEVLERDTTVFENILIKKFPRITYDDAVKILKGEQPVNGRTTVQALGENLESVRKKTGELEAEMEAKEAEMKQPGMKKGKLNFFQSRIDQIKNELKELEEESRNIPLWLESAKNFQYGGDLGGSDETVLTKMFDVPVMIYNWPHSVKAFYMKRDEKNNELAKGVDVLAPEGYGEIVGGGERETNKEWLIEKIHEHNLPMEAFEWYLDLRRYGSVPHAGFGLGLERMVAWICKLKHIRETIPFPRMYGRVSP
ncbi:MAG: asparagine--tRNA ligase [Bacteroidetes bacterium]|nr:asparagine--tRNA ligase [Bacteroidota bacterium]